MALMRLIRRGYDERGLLSRWQAGDRDALFRLLTLAYPDLLAMAERFLRREAPSHDLPATALVNELSIRLASQKQIKVNDRQRCFTVAAIRMRHILAGHARCTRPYARPSNAQR